MKIRDGFVSNSSSTAFIITNRTDQPLRLIDFVEENPQLIHEFCAEYSWHDMTEYSQRNLLLSAKENDESIPPGENQMIFGDEDGTLVGAVFDYALRDGGESERFRWRFKEWHR